MSRRPANDNASETIPIEVLRGLDGAMSLALVAIDVDARSFTPGALREIRAAKRWLRAVQLRAERAGLNPYAKLFRP